MDRRAWAFAALVALLLAGILGIVPLEDGPPITPGGAQTGQAERLGTKGIEYTVTPFPTLTPAPTASGREEHE